MPKEPRDRDHLNPPFFPDSCKRLGPVFFFLQLWPLTENWNFNIGADRLRIELKPVSSWTADETFLLLTEVQILMATFNAAFVRPLGV